VVSNTGRRQRHNHMLTRRSESPHLIDTALNQIQVGRECPKCGQMHCVNVLISLEEIWDPTRYTAARASKQACNYSAYMQCILELFGACPSSLLVLVFLALQRARSVLRKSFEVCYCQESMAPNMNRPGAKSRKAQLLCTRAVFATSQQAVQGVS